LSEAPVDFTALLLRMIAHCIVEMTDDQVGNIGIYGPMRALLAVASGSSTDSIGQDDERTQRRGRSEEEES
jgi:hypothetical protein